MFFTDLFSANIFFILHLVDGLIEIIGLVFNLCALHKIKKSVEVEIQKAKRKIKLMIICWCILMVSAINNFIITRIHNNPLNLASALFLNMFLYTVYVSQILVVLLSISLILIKYRIDFEKAAVSKEEYKAVFNAGISNLIPPFLILFYQGWQQVVTYIN